MNKKIFGAMLVMAFAVLFGCTGEGRTVYDCSKCNATTDCSKCPGPGNILTMIVPPSCTDSLCKLTETNGWAKEVGLETQVYNASWAQGTILLLYSGHDAYVFQPTPIKRGDFMKSVCTFTKDANACAFASEENNNATGDMKSCLQTSGISLGAVAFYHADWCPHCAKMKPWVHELEAKGYKFYWIEEQNSTAIGVLKNCLTTVIDPNGGYPQFGCPSNGKNQIGEFPSIDSMESFAKDCAAAAK